MNSEEIIFAGFLIALVIVVPLVLWMKHKEEQEEDDNYIGTKKRN